MQTSKCSSEGGTSFPGYCVGPSDIHCCVIGIGAGYFGVNVSSAITPTAANCFRSGGYSYVIPRGYRSTGSVDTAVCTSIVNAHNAGIPTKDTYMFPCPTCSKSAAQQMSELVNYLKTNCPSQWSGRIWLDIEGSQYWFSSVTSNQNWYKQLKDSCGTYGVRCGVYSSASQWSAIFGTLGFVYGNELPLWYAHYDNNPSFSDFSPFGGWTKPYAKQFAGDTTVCSMGVDLNYSPSPF